MMTDREKTQAEIEERLRQFGQSLSELKIKTEQRQEKFNGQMRQTLDALEGQHENARQRLQAMSSLADDDWSAAETDVNRYLADIDAGLRKALSYFK
jgi:TolA-binding protein